MTHRNARILVATIAMVASGEANAQGGTTDLAYHVSVGTAIYEAPTYPGARSSRRVWFPFIDADIDDRFYTSAADLLGVYAYKTTETQAGAAVEWDLTRRVAADDPRLHGLPNVNETARLKLFASHTVYFITGDANVATDVAGHGQGTLAQANLWFTIPFAATFSVSLGPGVSWADSKYMSTFYSVTPGEAISSPLSAFQTHAGIVDSHLNALAEWVILSRYRVGLSAYLAHLQDSAAASPITQRPTQATLVAWIAYRFR